MTEADFASLLALVRHLICNTWEKKKYVMFMLKPASPGYDKKKDAELFIKNRKDGDSRRN